MYKEVEGDLIELALSGQFDLIAHQTNCFCVQGAGIAKQFAKKFRTNDPFWYPLENIETRGDVNKIGDICYKEQVIELEPENKILNVANCYAQYEHGPNTDYLALALCFRKINHIFAGKHIGLPKIGCGIGNADWMTVSGLIKKYLKDCDVTVVNYNK
jgi:O-acetyl-ADP-ribose deacetylase (regulator of RNase III)